MDLIFIRHAESSNNRAYQETQSETNRVPDPGLTDLGHAQAEALAKWFPGFAPQPTKIFVSPFRRTLLTAAPLLEQLGATAEVLPDIMERGGPYAGSFRDQNPAPGSPRSELEPISPRLRFPDTVTEKGWWTGPTEDRRVATARARRLAEWLRGFEENECVVLVSHGAIGSLLLMALFCPPELEHDSERIAGESSSWFVLDNSSVSWVRTHPGGDTAIHAFNRVDHLVLAGLTSATMVQPS